MVGWLSREDTRKWRRLNNVKAKRGVVLVRSWCWPYSVLHRRGEGRQTAPERCVAARLPRRRFAVGQHYYGIRLTQVAMDSTAHKSGTNPVALLPCCPVALPRAADQGTVPSLIRWHMEMASGLCLPSAVTGEHACGAPHWTAPNASPDRTCAIRGRCGRWLSGGATGWTQTPLGFRDVSDSPPVCPASSTSGGGGGGGGSSGAVQLEGDPTIWPAITIMAVPSLSRCNFIMPGGKQRIRGETHARKTWGLLHIPGMQD